MRSYLLTFFLVVVAGAGLFAVASAHRYWVLRDLDERDLRLGQLLRYQEQKIARLPPGSIDTVLVGDSSLGNGIETRAFDAVAGTRSVSLALAGNFGFGGGLALLEQLAERQTIRNVVLVYSIDAMATGPAPMGFFFASPWPYVKGLPWRSQLALLRLYASTLLSGHSVAHLGRKWLRGEPWEAELPHDLFVHDYVISRAKIALAGLSYRVPRAVDPRSTLFLERLAGRCAAQGWNCVYAHGPILARSLAESPHASAYLERAGNAIQKAGLRVVAASPIALADDERGDTVFHAHIDARPAITHRYATLLQSMLQRSESPTAPNGRAQVRSAAGYR